MCYCIVGYCVKTVNIVLRALYWIIMMNDSDAAAAAAANDDYVKLRSRNVQDSGVGTGGSGGSMDRGPELLGPRVVGPQKNFR